MSTAESLGKIFKEKRTELGLKHEDVSGKTYISIGVIVDIESGVFDKLSPVYMKSFIKKYTDFLGLDTNEILKQYESVVRGISVKAFSVKVEQSPKEEKASLFEDMLPKKVKRSSLVENISAKKEKIVSPLKVVPIANKLQTVAVVLLIVVFIALVLALVNVTKKVLTSPPRQVPVVAPARSTGPRVKDDKTVSRKLGKKSASAKTIVSNISENSPVMFSLKARDRVWVQVASSSEGKIFDGFLNDGDSRSWKGEGIFTVWTGKANMLDFNVNGRDLGVVASGVVRNIKVSAEGVLVGDDWVVRL